MLTTAIFQLVQQFCHAGQKVCKKWWNGFWIQTSTQSPTKTELLLFGPFAMFLEICMQIHSVIFVLSRQINKQKYATAVNLLCEGKTFLQNIKLKGRGLTPSPLSCVRPWLSITWFSSGFQLSRQTVFLRLFLTCFGFSFICFKVKWYLRWKSNPKACNQSGLFFFNEHLDCDDRSMEPFTQQHWETLKTHQTAETSLM